MKILSALLAILLLPLPMWAMIPIADSQLSDVTGQAGVTINFDITYDYQYSQMGYGDSDGYAGFGTAGSGGWYGIDSLQQKTVHIWPRTDFTMDNTTFAGGPAYQPDEGGWNELKYLTIDVATVPASILGSVFGTNVTDVTAVVIGIPTVSLTMASMEGNVVLGPRKAAQSVGGQIDGTYVNAKNIQGPGFNQLLGQFYLGGLNMATGGGTIYIFAHGTGSTIGAVSGSPLYGSGVTIALNNVTISYLLLDTQSWGDIDGLYATGFATSGAPAGNATWGLMGPGWVGGKDIAIKDVVINGALAIDVFTVRAPGAAGTFDPISSIDDSVKTPAGLAGQYKCLVGAFNDIYFNTPPGSITTPTGVSISIKNGTTLSVGALYYKVQAGSVKTLDVNQEWYEMYYGGLSLTVQDNPVTGNGSFLHIMAH